MKKIEEKKRKEKRNQRKINCTIYFLEIHHSGISLDATFEVEFPRLPRFQGSIVNKYT
jgi:hypothetical protein